MLTFYKEDFTIIEFNSGNIKIDWHSNQKLHDGLQHGVDDFNYALRPFSFTLINTRKHSE